MNALAPDVHAINRDPDLEWLDLIRPTGLVLSPTVIKERGLVPERQTASDSAAFAACLSEEGPALPEPWRLRSLATVAGRPMLAGLNLVLGRFRLFNAPANQRLRPQGKP